MFVSKRRIRDYTGGTGVYISLVTSIRQSEERRIRLRRLSRILKFKWVLAKLVYLLRGISFYKMSPLRCQLVRKNFSVNTRKIKTSSR